MRYRCAVLDDYQNVALSMADWSKVTDDIDVTVFNERLGDEAAVARALQGFQIVCVMRERTPFPRSLIEKLPDLKLIVTTGLKNASIDVTAAKERGILVCGTEGAKHPTAELAIGLMIDLARHISAENARMKAGEPWQATVGADLFGHTLGIIGLGNLGQRVAKVGQAFGMKVIAWSPNLTLERCQEHGVAYATKADLFQQSDFITIHLVLSDRTRGLISATDLGMMKPTAYLINTSRGPIVDEGALIAALQNNAIAGAGLDVFDTEPLPRDHALRTLPNVVLTPHLGYVTQDGYRIFYGGTVEAVRAFLDGKPVRVIG
ncbi:D-2-hydroxyacid dehydrogenase family protein [Pseudorhodoplanes sp.]|uniref:D-2-hydroxyacid dehydrogenase family protein n=1 Tax=Pseudorhodoplanes sp. TaxID=1934341 RepID=UPI003919A826